MVMKAGAVEVGNLWPTIGFPNYGVLVAFDTSADFITIDLHEAVDALAEITGEGAPDELIHRIFKDFCVGK